MIKWFRKLSRQEKTMVILIVVLIVGIILRWGFVKKEIGDAFRGQFKKSDQARERLLEKQDSTAVIRYEDAARESGEPETTE